MSQLPVQLTSQIFKLIKIYASFILNLNYFNSEKKKITKLLISLWVGFQRVKSVSMVGKKNFEREKKK